MEMNPVKLKAAITAKIRKGSNSIEAGYYEGMRLVFDHETGNKMLFGFDVYGQGFSECWSNKSGIDASYHSFKEMVR
jgi:hypothetical protein